MNIVLEPKLFHIYLKDKFSKQKDIFNDNIQLNYIQKIITNDSNKFPKSKNYFREISNYSKDYKDITQTLLVKYTQKKRVFAFNLSINANEDICGYAKECDGSFFSYKENCTSCSNKCPLVFKLINVNNFSSLDKLMFELASIKSGVCLSYSKSAEKVLIINLFLNLANHFSSIVIKDDYFTDRQNVLSSLLNRTLSNNKTIQFYTFAKGNGTLSKISSSLNRFDHYNIYEINKRSLDHSREIIIGDLKLKCDHDFGEVLQGHDASTVYISCENNTQYINDLQSNSSLLLNK